MMGQSLRFSHLVSEELVTSFQRDGVVCLRAAFPLFWLDRLALGIERNLKDLSPGGVRYSASSAPGGFFDDYCGWRRFPEYREFIFDSGAGALAARLMKSRRARLFHEHVLVKEPGTREVSPWHHDQPYYCVDGNQLCSIWLPLDPVPVTVAPQFVAGSHLWGKLFAPRKFIDHRSYEGALPAFEPVPDISRSPEDYDIRSWPLEPGDCLVFHMRTLHAAPGTEGLDGRRRAFATRWLGDDAIFARRPFETSPPFPEVQLEPGDPMEHELFPVTFEEPA